MTTPSLGMLNTRRNSPTCLTPHSTPPETPTSTTTSAPSRTPSPRPRSKSFDVTDRHHANHTSQPDRSLYYEHDEQPQRPSGQSRATGHLPSRQGRGCDTSTTPSPTTPYCLTLPTASISWKCLATYHWSPLLRSIFAADLQAISTTKPTSTSSTRHATS